MSFDLEKIDLGSFGINQDTQPLEAVMSEAVKVNPDQQTRINKLSKESGVPTFAVEQAPDQVETDLKLKQIDFSQMSKRNPNTAEYLVDFNNAAIAHDDINILQTLEDWSQYNPLVAGSKVIESGGVERYTADVGKAFEQGTAQVDLSSVGVVKMWADIGAGQITPEQMQRYTELNAQMDTPSPTENYNFLAGIPVAVAEQLPIMGEILGSGITAAADTAFKGAMVGGSAAAITGAGVVPGMVAGGALGAKYGGRVGVAVASFNLEAGLAKAEFDNMKDEAGNMLDPEIASYAAVATGAINASLEMLSLTALGRTLTDGSRAVIRQRVKQAMGTESGRDVVMRIAKSYMRYVGTEATTEVLQEFTNVVAGEVAKFSDANAFTEQGVGDTIDNIFSPETGARLTEAGVKGAQVSLGFGLPGVAVQTHAHIREKQAATERQSTVEQQRIDKLNDIAAESKLKQRDNEAFQQFMRKVDGDNNTHIFIDGVQTSLYLQGKTQEEIQSDPALKLLSDSLGDNAQLNGDVAIPIDKFTGVIANTDHFTQLRDSMTMSEETVSPFRQAEVKQQTDNYVQSMMTEAEQNVSMYVEAQTIFEGVKQQLIDTGRVSPQHANVVAKLVPAWVTATAVRTGRTVQEVAALVPSILGPQSGKAADLAAREAALLQAKSEGYTGETHGEAKEWLSAKQKGLDMSTEARRERATQMGFDTGKTMYHGTGADIKGFDLSFAGKTDEGFHGRGVYLSQDAEYASAYAPKYMGEPNTIKAYVRLDNPYIRPSQATHGDDWRTAARAENAKYGIDNDTPSAEVTRLLQEAGFDGVIIRAERGGEVVDFETVVFDPSKIRSVNAAFDPESVESTDLLAQSPAEQSDVKNLFVAHNLSAENIIAADKLGGLAAPSIAVGKTDAGFDNFGEVTLLADPKLLSDPKAKTFDADIYSPRQPRSEYDIDTKMFYEFIKSLDGENLGLSKPQDLQDVERNGADLLIRSDAVKLKWLQSVGKAPKVKNLRVDPLINKALKLNAVNVEDEAFVKLATQYYRKKVDDLVDQFPDRSLRFEEMYFTDGELNPRKVYDFSNEVRSFKKTQGKDIGQFRSDINAKFRNKKLNTEYEQWVTEQFNNMVKGERLFKGFTPSGNRKYIAYNLDNVVKEMTQQLQAGESTFYGAGTVRSAYATQLKTLDQIRSKRDKIISSEDFEKIKEESNAVFEKALDDLKPFYKYDADGWGYLNDAGSAIAEGPKGQREAFNLTPESKKIIDDLTEYLSALPTQYFESKIQRAVDFSEFSVAIVPKGINKDALQVLKNAGLKIKTYDGSTKTRDQLIAEQQDLLFQSSTDGARGYYDPANSLIRLNETSDLSTFIHEFAHFMYEMEKSTSGSLLSDINAWVMRNVDAVAKEAGEYAPNTTIIPTHVRKFVEDGTTGDTERDSAINRAIHEQFARGFETYIMKGEAPSMELRNAFRTMARWIVDVYKKIKGQLGVNVDPEMKEVFDRMLATEEQIEQAKARARIAPLFTDAAMSGMTQDQWEKYQADQAKTEDKASETLRDKLIEELTRKTKQWWKTEKQDIIDAEMVKLSDEPVYAARNRLKNGDIKLDLAVVKEMVGEEKVDKKGRKSIRVPSSLSGMTKGGAEGVHPDLAAAMFGYNSGAEMIHDLMNAAPIKDVAEKNAEAEMKRRHGDMLNDGTIEKAADEALQNEERATVMLAELKALGRITGRKTLDRQMIKQVAEERIAKLSFRKIFPSMYRKAEIKAAQDAIAAVKDGNMEAAAEAKTRQLVNYYLGKAATEAKADIVSLSDNMNRYSKKAVRLEIMKAENGYMEQIDKILNRFEFRKSASLKGVQDLNTWVKERIDNDGDALMLSPEVLDELYTTHWKEVPLETLQGISDSVKNIEHVARYANKIKRGEQEMDFKELVQRWVDHINNQPTRFKTVASAADKPNAAVRYGRFAMAQMTKIPYMMSWLDGGERAGMSHDVIMQPFNDAYDAEVRLFSEVAKPVLELIEGRSKEDIKRHAKVYFIPEIKGTNGHTGNLTGSEILAIALNTGNTGNLRKMLLGEGWANPDIEEEISRNNVRLNAVLKHMTKSDWVMVQKIWDQMELLYPMLAAVHRETTGLEPPKVVATPFTNQYGEFKGGYYPVKYDPSRDFRAQQNEDKLNAETESMFSSMSLAAQVNAGATNERTGYYGPIKLTLDVIPSHFQETIHFITHHKAVRETNKLISNKQVNQAITAKLGIDEFRQLKPWLNDIAKDGRESPTKMFWETALRRLRFGTTLGVMGFKASTGIMQISGLSNTVAEVGLANTIQAMRSILGNTTDMREAWEFARDNSKILAHREKTMDREIAAAVKRLEGKRGILAGAQEMSMKHIALIQTYMVDLPTWHAAYIKAMKEHGDETRAYRYADWAVENIQGSGLTKDMAQIMRNQSEVNRMLTMFMTFFSSLWNMERDLVKGARSGKYSTTTVGAKIMFLFVIPVLFEMMIRGEFGDDDDLETEVQKTLLKVGMYPISSVPFVRDIATGVTGDYGYNISPIAQLIETGVTAIPEVVTRGFTDEEITYSQAKNTVKFVGAAAGVPGTSQAFATGEHLYEVLQQGEELTLQELLFGPKKK